MKIEVHGSEDIIYRTNGKEVLRFQKPEPDPENLVESAEAFPAAGSPKMLSYCHIVLQAEGQGVWFRNIELKSLED